jgi:hypothetical protein
MRGIRATQVRVPFGGRMPGVWSKRGRRSC